MDNTKVYLYGQEVVTPYYLNEAVADKATKVYVDEAVADAVDEASKVFANYYTKEEVEQLIAQAVAEALGTTEAALDEIIEGGE